ncbi:MAG: pyridoxamine 5'-phosphate oxidase family protein [Alphaproteobacteria bacterium]|nr:pyridoxamine 5'-phosphate oxidase family protein [Alphaproteobacteria bacterium]
MDHALDQHLVRDVATLEAIYGAASEASQAKEVDHVHPLYARFIEKAPFFVLATGGPGGMDASPRGDAAGFVTVADPRTLLIPDRRGNNRIDSLRNILADPRVALLFLVPGVGETLRVNGRASISIEPALLERFAVGEKAPRSVLVVAVETVYFQCSKAIVRSGLWDPTRHVARSALPTSGTILATLSGERINAAEYDAALPERVRATLY